MYTLEVRQGQSLLDVAVERLGSVEGAIGVSLANGVSLTEDLRAGSELRPAPVEDKRTAAIYEGMTHKPATALTADDEALDEEINIFDDTFDETFE